MIRRPPITTRTDPLCPYTTLCRALPVPGDSRLSEVGHAIRGRPEQRVGVDRHVLRHVGAQRTPGNLGQQHVAHARRCLRSADDSSPTCMRDASPHVQHDIAADHLYVAPARSEEHTSGLQSLMRISYAVFCLKKKTITNTQVYTHQKPSHLS